MFKIGEPFQNKHYDKFNSKLTNRFNVENNKMFSKIKYFRIFPYYPSFNFFRFRYFKYCHLLKTKFRIKKKIREMFFSKGFTYPLYIQKTKIKKNINYRDSYLLFGLKSILFKNIKIVKFNLLFNSNLNTSVFLIKKNLFFLSKLPMNISFKQFKNLIKILKTRFEFNSRKK